MTSPLRRHTSTTLMMGHSRTLLPENSAASLPSSPGSSPNHAQVGPATPAVLPPLLPVHRREAFREDGWKRRQTVPNAPLRRNTAEAGGLTREVPVPTPFRAPSVVRGPPGTWASRLRLVLLLAGWLFCGVAWAVGAFLEPSVEVRLMQGTRFARSITRSLARTLMDLFKQGKWFSLSVLGIFSVVVPLAKLLCTLGLIWRMARWPLRDVLAAHGGAIWALTTLASYQLIDVYVGIIFVAYFNSSSAQAELLNGFHCFFWYCMASLFCSEMLAGAFVGISVKTAHGAPGAQVVEGIEEEVGAMLCGVGVPTPTRAALLPWGGAGGHPPAPGAGCAASPGGLRQSPPLRMGPERPRSAPRPLPDTRLTLIFATSFVVMIIACAAGGGPLLEVRTLFSGVTVDRSAASALELPWRCLQTLMGPDKPLVATILALMNLVLPILYVVALVAAAASSALSKRSEVAESGDEDATARATGTAAPAAKSYSAAAVFGAFADCLRPWVTLDVFILASLLFLFTLQDQHTLTRTPEGSYDYYTFLGAGMSFFFLRWFVEAPATTKGGASWLSTLGPRLILLLLVWGASSTLILIGVPGASLQLKFPTLDSVCEQVLPVVDGAVRHGVPAAYGDCNDSTAAPPQPCRGHGLLMNTTLGNSFAQAVWLGGIDTLKLDKCHLWRGDGNHKRTSNLSTSNYHLAVGGVFARLPLFLHLKQCGPFGCTKTMSGADHCCGNNIRFSLTFGVVCRLDDNLKPTRDIAVERCDIDPMLFDQPTLKKSWYKLSMTSLDISPQVEEMVERQIRKFMAEARIPWGGRELTVSQLMDLMIGYNSPQAANSC